MSKRIKRDLSMYKSPLLSSSSSSSKHKRGGGAYTKVRSAVTDHGTVQWPKHPFKMLVQGMNRSGKTYFSTTTLREHYQNVFDVLYVFTPTWKFDPQYRRIKHLAKHVRQWDHFTDDMMGRIMKQLRRHQYRWRVLVLIDDPARDFNNRTQMANLDDAILINRWINMSIVYAAQQFVNLRASMRDNRDVAVVFLPSNGKTLRNIHEHLIGETFKITRQILNRAFTWQYGHLIIVYGCGSCARGYYNDRGEVLYERGREL
jgi:hypothetical protein